jgi:hypothetical protein
MAAIKYADLSNGLNKDYVFDVLETFGAAPFVTRGTEPTHDGAPWQARLRRDRLARGLSHRDLARALIDAAGSLLAGYSERSVERTVKRWESGAVYLGQKRRTR